MVIFDPGNKFPHPKRNCFEDKNRSFSGSIQIKYSAMVNTRNKFKRLITKHVLGFFLQSLPNMTLIPVKTKGIKAEEASRYIACGIIDVNTASVYTDLLEKALTRDGVRVSQSFDSVDQRIYSCLDGLSEKENVLLPHQALGKLNWILLLLSFLLVTLFAATIFKGIFKGIFYSNRRTTILRTMLECAFFFLSYLLQNRLRIVTIVLLHYYYVQIFFNIVVAVRGLSDARNFVVSVNAITLKQKPVFERPI